MLAHRPVLLVNLQDAVVIIEGVKFPQERRDVSGIEVVLEAPATTALKLEPPKLQAGEDVALPVQRIFDLLLEMNP